MEKRWILNQIKNVNIALSLSLMGLSWERKSPKHGRASFMYTCQQLQPSKHAFAYTG